MLLLDLLNGLIRSGRHTVNLNYLPTERPGSTEADRKVVFDIYCETERGEKIVVEM